MLRAQIGGVVAGAPRVPAVELAVKLNVNREVGRAGGSEVQGQRASRGLAQLQLSRAAKAPKLGRGRRD